MKILRLHEKRALRLVIAMACGASLAVATAGCAADEGTAPPTPGSDKGEMVLFSYPSSDNYVAAWQKGAKDAADELGYTLKFVENNFDQAAENNQVQQQIASGSKPVAYGWLPVDQQVGLSSLRALSQQGVPIGQFLTVPDADAQEYVDLYTGVDFVANGEVSATEIDAARTAKVEQGGSLHSEGGNLVILSWPEALTITAQKQQGLDAGLAKLNAFGSTANFFAPSTDNAGGYSAMSAAIAAAGSNGIDVVYAMNDALAAGAIQALTAAGLEPGTDVMVVGGNCHGDPSDLVSGQQFSSILVAGELEGRYWVSTMDRLLQNGGEVESGTAAPAPDPDARPEESGPPSKMNIVPQIPVQAGSSDPAENRATLDDTKLWGVTYSQACTY